MSTLLRPGPLPCLRRLAGGHVPPSPGTSPVQTEGRPERAGAGPPFVGSEGVVGSPRSPSRPVRPPVTSVAHSPEVEGVVVLCSLVGGPMR